MATIFDKTGTVTADVEWELDPLDLSQTRQLRVGITVPEPTGLVTDTLDIYLCSRGPAGVWEDRIHALQLLGNQSGAQYLSYTLQSDVPLGADEEAGVIPGPSPAAARLTADTVRHGYLPPAFWGATVNNMPTTAFKFIFDKGGAGTPSFPNIRITVDSQEKDVGY